MRYTVLVVEDDVAMAAMLKATLSAEFEVVTCTEKAHAVKRAKAYLQDHCPDVLVVDLIINGEGGMDLYKWVRANGILCPVIFLTGCHSQSPEYLEAQKTGELVYEKDHFSSKYLVKLLQELAGKKAS